jgi:hypothetical protein
MSYCVVTAEDDKGLVKHFCAPTLEAAMSWGYLNFSHRSDWAVMS